jgi:hypothetical protein
MPTPCRSAKGLDFVFPILFTQCGGFWFAHAMPRPCRSHAMPGPCRSESDFSTPRHRAARVRHGMCELASAVQRRHVGDLSAFGFFRLVTLKSGSRTSCSDISVYHADFHEGHSTVGEWHGRGMVLWINAAGERHGMCELALSPLCKR